MKPNARALALLASAALCAVTAPVVRAQQVDGAAIVSGYVSDQFGQPVERADVLIEDAWGAHQTRTGDAGLYSISGLAPGPRAVRVRRLGYLPLKASVTLRPDAVENRDFVLLKLPSALDATLVQRPDGELRGDFARFTERRRSGVGVFIDRAAIDRSKVSATIDIMRAVAGFRVRHTKNGGEALVSLASGAPATRLECVPHFFVDGVPYTPADGLGDFDPEMLEAIEAYGPGLAAPAPFGAGDCSSIVVWLRR